MATLNFSAQKGGTVIIDTVLVCNSVTRAKFANFTSPLLAAKRNGEQTAASVQFNSTPRCQDNKNEADGAARLLLYGFQHLGVRIHMLFPDNDYNYTSCGKTAPRQAAVWRMAQKRRGY